MSVRIDAVGLDALQATLRGAAHRVETRVARFLDGGLGTAKATMVDATPIGKTGDLARDWHIRATGLLARALTNDSPHAAATMYGARPHAIPGAFGYPAPFGESPTFHPGNKPNERMLAALDAAGLRLREDWGREGQRLAFALLSGKDTP